jgi:AraC-like DNA-binding protein
MVAELEKIIYDDNGGFQAEYISATQGFWHFHPEYEINFSRKCNGTRIVGDNIELFDNYDLVLIGSNIPPCWNYSPNSIFPPEERGIIIHFTLNSLGEDFLSQHELNSVKQLLTDAERGLLFSVEDAKKTEEFLVSMVNNKGIEKMISFFHILNIMCKSLRRHPLCSENYKRACFETGKKKMTDVYNYIRENYSKPITLTKISSIAQMSPFAFTRYFKRNSGACFIEYLNCVRMNKACHLLRETKYRIHDIAFQCGFSSVSNFNKQFRKAESLSPTEYRAKYK